QLVRVTEENLRRDLRQLERITESNRVGALSLADVYRQQSQVAQDELSLIKARNESDKAKADLIALIGLDVGKEYVIADSTLGAVPEPNPGAPGAGEFGELLRRALAARPDYLGGAEDLQAASSSVTSARAGYFPSVSAFAGHYLSNAELGRLSGNRTTSWGLNLRWSLFDGFQTNQAIQSAGASRRTAEILLEQAERDIAVELRKALLDLEAARKAVDVSQKGLVSAVQDRTIAEERYNLGAGTLLDLLQGNAGLVAAQANGVNAAHDLLIARRNLEYVLGERSY
ncbi:MAG: TolC family protein, partial [Bacteroidota bacterium]